MEEYREDMKEDITPEDRHETPQAMEPLVLSDGSRHRARLSDLAVELAGASAGFRRSLPPGVITPLADLVRAMNCYYSNLIEGHATHPVDIERALAGEYSREATGLLEEVAHERPDRGRLGEQSAHRRGHRA